LWWKNLRKLKLSANPAAFILLAREPLDAPFRIKKPGHLFRQPGYLGFSETRGFPPPPRDGFGFF